MLRRILPKVNTVSQLIIGILAERKWLASDKPTSHFAPRAVVRNYGAVIVKSEVHSVHFPTSTNSYFTNSAPCALSIAAMVPLNTWLLKNS